MRSGRGALDESGGQLQTDEDDALRPTTLRGQTRDPAVAGEGPQRGRGASAVSHAAAQGVQF